MKKAQKFIVRGTVQGVFFRQFVSDTAKKYDLTGFVRNLESGDVEIIAEGEGEQLSRFEHAIKVGPEHATIREVTAEERTWSGEFKEFKVIRF